MQRGWNIKGKLTRLYAKHGGGKGLAELSGIAESSIRGYNSGKRDLGIPNARKLVAKVPEVTWDYLGIPDPDSEGRPDLPVLIEQLRVLLAETLSQLPPQAPAAKAPRRRG
jgi:hypothetical protein